MHASHKPAFAEPGLVLMQSHASATCPDQLKAADTAAVRHSISKQQARPNV